MTGNMLYIGEPDTLRFYNLTIQITNFSKQNFAGEFKVVWQVRNSIFSEVKFNINIHTYVMFVLPHDVRVGEDVNSGEDNYCECAY